MKKAFIINTDLRNPWNFELYDVLLSYTLGRDVVMDEKSNKKQN